MIPGLAVLPVYVNFEFEKQFVFSFFKFSFQIFTPLYLIGLCNLLLVP